MSHQSLSILIIDDSTEDRALYRRLISKSSYFDCTVEEADTLAKGVALCELSHFDGILLDYYLPDGEGVQFFERCRQHNAGVDFFTIMLTGQGSEAIAVQALVGGASDYLSKSLIDATILDRSMVSAYEKLVLRRAIRSEQHEKDRLIVALQEALSEVKRLGGLLPICAHCKSVRNDEGYWEAVETYFSERSDTMFSHGICPECMVTHFGVCGVRVDEQKNDSKTDVEAAEPL